MGENRCLVSDLQEKIEKLEEEKKILLDYIESIDDRNSLKLQIVKSDMTKILVKK